MKLKRIFPDRDEQGRIVIPRSALPIGREGVVYPAGVDPDTGEGDTKVVRDSATVLVETIDAVTSQPCDPPERWNVAQKLINLGISVGWLTLKPGQVVLLTPRGEVAYDIVRPPGKYEDGVHFDFDERQKEENPAGYLVTNHFECRLASAAPPVVEPAAEQEA